MREEFPNVTFRMSHEKLEDEEEEDTRFGGGGLESLVCGVAHLSTHCPHLNMHV